jgi:hypothetical protein
VREARAGLAGCSRPPCRCDFPRCTVPIGSGGPRCGPRRAAADAGRWAGGFLGVRLQSACSARLQRQRTEAAVPLPNRIRYLRSSARLLAPASHHLPVTHVVYASPPLHHALRLWLHGSARLSYLRVCPCVCTAKGIALMCAARHVATSAAPPNPRCSRPPCRCDFSSSVCTDLLAAPH